VSKYGFWVDVSNRKFDDVGWIHALPIGKYEHPVYGELEFTPEKVNDFALSVKNRVRGIDPDIDYDHKATDGKAAGWVKDAKVEGDGLHLQVEWTKAASEAIKNGEYKYFSPEFDDEWTDGKGQKHTNVLFGGALTNRPFLKDLLPVNLSELAAQGGNVPPTPPTPTPSPAPTSSGPVGSPPNQGPAQLSDEAINKLLAEHPLIKQLQEQVQSTTTKLAEAERATKLAETRGRLKALTASQGGKKFVLPPSVIDAIAEGTVAGDPVKMSEAFVGALEQLTKTGYVELGERGKMSGGAAGQEKDSTTQLNELVLQTRANHFKVTGKQLGYADAVRAVAGANPELYLEHRADSYAGKEDS
jgi:hypothetical protein